MGPVSRAVLVRRGAALAALAAAVAAAAVAVRPKPSAGVVPEAVPPFEDATAASGIRFALRSPDRLLNIRDTAGSGCAFLDADGDGLLDLLFAGRDRAALYLNTGSGRFRDATEGSGLPRSGHWIGVAAGDCDRDGDPDVFLNGYGCAALLRNEGGGRFRDVTAGSGLRGVNEPHRFGTSAAWGDLDDDGWLDLYLCRYVRFRPGMREFCDRPDGHRETCVPRHYEPDTGSLYRNLGGRRFEDATRAWGGDAVHGKAWGAAFFDFDEDGFQDLFLANDEMPCDLLRNLGGRRLENVGVESGVAYDADGRVHGAMGVDAGDYDGDGRLDLVVTTFMNELYSLYRNNDGRTFTDLAAAAGIGTPTRPWVGWGTRLFDYDSDGRLDLLFVNGHATDTDRRPGGLPEMAQPLQLFRSEGARFAPVAIGPLAAPIVGRGAAFGDYDNDGFTDVAVVDMEGPARLLRNRAASRNHWLGIELAGVRSNREGLGARVTVRAGGRTAVAEAQTAGSVFSSNDPRLRFGLGAAAAADEVAVRWPGGATDRLTAVPADRYIRIVEGAGRAAIPR